MLHILLDNQSHDSTGGNVPFPIMLTLSTLRQLVDTRTHIYVHSLEELEKKIRRMEENKRTYFFIFKISPGSTQNLGRPKITP